MFFGYCHLRSVARRTCLQSSRGPLEAVAQARGSLSAQPGADAGHRWGEGAYLEGHALTVPDEFAAITAANRWLSKAAPEGRPFELAADASGYATGAVKGRATKDSWKLRVLGRSAHLSLRQQTWHPFEQEFGVFSVRGARW